MAELDKLDHYDRKILLELDSDARQALSQLARKVRLGSDLVDYRVKRLLDSGLISELSPIVNPHALGVTIFKTYIRHRLSPLKRKQLIKRIQRHPRKYWLAEGYGRWDLLFSLAAQNSYQFQQDQDKLLSQIADSVVDMSVTTNVESTRFPKNYLWKKNKPAYPSWGEQRKAQKLDTLSREILEQLSSNARASHSELARELGTSAAKVKARIEKMEQEKVILGYRVQFDYEKLGLVVCKVFVTFHSASPELRRCLLKYCSEEPSITCYVQQIGAAQVEFEAELRDYRELHRLLDNFKEKFHKEIVQLETMMIDRDHFHRVPINELL